MAHLAFDSGDVNGQPRTVDGHFKDLRSHDVDPLDEGRAAESLDGVTGQRQLGRRRLIRLELGMLRVGDVFAGVEPLDDRIAKLLRKEKQAPLPVGNLGQILLEEILLTGLEGLPHALHRVGKLEHSEATEADDRLDDHGLPESFEKRGNVAGIGEEHGARKGHVVALEEIALVDEIEKRLCRGQHDEVASHHRPQHLLRPGEVVPGCPRPWCQEDHQRVARPEVRRRPHPAADVPGMLRLERQVEILPVDHQEVVIPGGQHRFDLPTVDGKIIVELRLIEVTDAPDRALLHASLHSTRIARYPAQLNARGRDGHVDGLVRPPADFPLDAAGADLQGGALDRHLDDLPPAEIDSLDQRRAAEPRHRIAGERELFLGGVMAIGQRVFPVAAELITDRPLDGGVAELLGEEIKRSLPSGDRGEVFLHEILPPRLQGRPHESGISGHPHDAIPSGTDQRLDDDHLSEIPNRRVDVGGGRHQAGGGKGHVGAIDEVALVGVVEERAWGIDRRDSTPKDLVHHGVGAIEIREDRAGSGGLEDQQCCRCSQIDVPP